MSLLDILFLLTTAALFVLAGLYVSGCARLGPAQDRLQPNSQPCPHDRQQAQGKTHA